MLATCTKSVAVSPDSAKLRWNVSKTNFGIHESRTTATKFGPSPDQIHTSSPYSAQILETCSIISIFGSRKWGLSSAFGARRNQLNSIGSEDNQVTDILLELSRRPTVIGVDLRPVAKLVASQAIPGSS
jgi:hypothetical protein